MSIESDLRKDGIEVVSKLNTIEVNSIANCIANKLVSAFPEFNLKSNELFSRLSKINMYKAKIPDGMAEANYFYKNSSIYFNVNLSFEDLEEFAVHECIHHLQEVKDNKNHLLKMGLCDLTEFKIYGMGLNEAAVQLMTSKAMGTEKEDVKYFGINFVTDSPNCYPLECTLAKQMAYITGEYALYESALFATDSFKNKFIQATSKETFIAIENAIDDIINAEEAIIKINNKIQTIEDRNKKVDHLVNKINTLKNKIAVTFMRTQNLIISSYFDREFNKISTIEQIEDYRKELYNFQKFIGISDDYVFFNNYYIEKMAALDHKYNVIENGGIETAVIEQKAPNKLILIFRAIKSILFNSAQDTQVRI